jgi:hypothetical protein
MTSSQKVGHLNQKLQLKRKPKRLFTIYGKLVSPHNIKTSNHRYYRLNEHRDDDLGVYMYWMLLRLPNGKYEVLKRLDPRYCEAEERREIHSP